MGDMISAGALVYARIYGGRKLEGILMFGWNSVTQTESDGLNFCAVKGDCFHECAASDDLCLAWW